MAKLNEETIKKGDKRKRDSDTVAQAQDPREQHKRSRQKPLVAPDPESGPILSPADFAARLVPVKNRSRKKEKIGGPIDKILVAKKLTNQRSVSEPVASELQKAALAPPPVAPGRTEQLPSLSVTIVSTPRPPPVTTVPSKPKDKVPRKGKNSTQLSGADREKLLEDNCSLFVDPLREHKIRTQEFWAAVQEHISKVYYEHQTKLGGLTQVYLSGVSFILVTFSTPAWRNVFLEVVSAVLFTFSVQGKPTKIELVARIFGDTGVPRIWQVIAPRTKGSAVGDALQRYFSKNSIKHPGFAVRQLYTSRLPTATFFIRFEGTHPRQ